MASIFEIAGKMERINLNILAAQAIEENEDDINKRNREQLEKGTDRNGKKIKPKYKSKSYAKRKNKMNSAAGLGTPDLKVTGQLHDEIGVIVEGVDVFVTSFDEKMKYKSIQQYLPNAFGLNRKNQTENRQLNNRTLIRNFKKLTGL